MTRRNFIALVSLCVFVALGVVAVGVGLAATRTEVGQRQIRHWIEARVASSINGKLHIGRIGGNFLTGITIDSLEIRDEEDSLFVATGRVALRYDPRDLVDRRLYLRSVVLDHPAIVLRQHEKLEVELSQDLQTRWAGEEEGPRAGLWRLRGAGFSACDPRRELPPDLSMAH